MHFFQELQIFFDSKEEKWAESNFWASKYISMVKKESFIDIYLIGFKAEIRNGIFFGTEEVLYVEMKNNFYKSLVFKVDYSF